MVKKGLPPHMLALIANEYLCYLYGCVFVLSFHAKCIHTGVIRFLRFLRREKCVFILNK